jgi:sporulation protein YlmC with PRC-barrel domain
MKPNPAIAIGAALALSAMAALAAPAPAAETSPSSSAQRSDAAAAPTAARQGEFRLIDAASLMDADVTSSDGKNVGKLKFLMIDPSDARVVLALVGTSTDYSKFVALPWDKVELNGWRGNGGQISLKVPQKAVESAQTYTTADVGRLTNPIEQTKLFNLYASAASGAQGQAQNGFPNGESGQDQSAQAGPNARTDNGQGSSDQNRPYVFLGHEFVATMADPALTLDNQLQGSEIYSGGKNSQKIGEITKLMIDADRGKVAFAVVATSQYLGIGERDIAIPLQALDWTASGRYVLAQDRLDQMKNQDENDIDSRGASPFTSIPQQRMDKLYGALGVKPYWQG